METNNPERECLSVEETNLKIDECLTKAIRRLETAHSEEFHKFTANPNVNFSEKLDKVREVSKGMASLHLISNDQQVLYLSTRNNEDTIFSFQRFTDVSAESGLKSIEEKLKQRGFDISVAEGDKQGDKFLDVVKTQTGETIRLSYHKHMNIYEEYEGKVIVMRDQPATEFAFEVAGIFLGEDKDFITHLNTNLLKCLEEDNWFKATAKLLELVTDEQVLERLKADEHSAAATVCSLISKDRITPEDPSPREIAQETLINSPEALIDYLIRHFRYGSKDIPSAIKETYLETSQRLLLSRRVTIPELVAVYNREPCHIFACLTDPNVGEAYYMGRNKVALHYNDSVALRCGYYTGDVDLFGAGIDPLKDLPMSMPDAKLYWATEKAEGSAGYQEARSGKTRELGLNIFYDLEEVVEVCVPDEETREKVLKYFPPTLISIAKEKKIN